MDLAKTKDTITNILTQHYPNNPQMHQEIKQRFNNVARMLNSKKKSIVTNDMYRYIIHGGVDSNNVVVKQELWDNSNNLRVLQMNISHLDNLVKLHELQGDYLQHKMDYYFLRPKLRFSDLSKTQIDNKEVMVTMDSSQQKSSLKIKNIAYLDQTKYEIGKDKFIEYFKQAGRPEIEIGESLLLQIFGKLDLGQFIEPVETTIKCKIRSLDHLDFLKIVSSSS